MSVDVYKLVVSRTVGSRNRKAVLSRMAWAAHNDGSNCYLSKKRMVAETEIPRSTFYEVIKQLERDGLIIRFGMAGAIINYSLNIALIRRLPIAHEKPPRNQNSIDATGDSIVQQPDDRENHTVQQSNPNHPAAGREESGSRTQMTTNENNYKRGPENKEDRFVAEPSFTARQLQVLHHVAEKLRQGAHVAPNALTTYEASYILHHELVTKDMLRRAGIAF